MLYNEVAIYLQVDHPNICKLLEVFVENGQTPKVVVPDPTEPLVNGVTPPGDSRRSSVTGDVCGQNASAKAAVVVSPGSEDLTPGE
ncbi:calcium-dependent protein kinase cdpk4, partial [Cystoisospora suis]